MGDALTAGDETGARAERLAGLRSYHDGKRPHGPPCECGSCNEQFLLAELDRVTAELDTLAEHKGPIHVVIDERDAAIASRNAWAEKCAALEAERHYADVTPASAVAAEITVTRENNEALGLRVKELEAQCAAMREALTPMAAWTSAILAEWGGRRAAAHRRTGVERAHGAEAVSATCLDHPNQAAATCDRCAVVALTAQLAECRAVLKEVEHFPTGDDDTGPQTTCPYCLKILDGNDIDGLPPDSVGHAPDCRLEKCLV